MQPPQTKSHLFNEVVLKNEQDHNCCRTAAIVSAKVSCVLLYQADDRSDSCPRWCRSLANRVTSENNANKHGVVRAMARSFHCLWLSTPTCARTSAYVVSSCQRKTNHCTICAGVTS